MTQPIQAEVRERTHDLIPVPRSLLMAARDYIGSMPTIDCEGVDRFLSAARVVEPIERLLLDAIAAAPKVSE